MDLASKLGDVQEETELAAALAASAAQGSVGVSEEWTKREAKALAANDAALEQKRRAERQERLEALQARDPKKRKLGRASRTIHVPLLSDGIKKKKRSRR